MCAIDPIKTTYGNKTLWIDCATCGQRTRPLVEYQTGSSRPEDRKIHSRCEVCRTYGKIVKIELRERDPKSPGRCDARCLNGRKSCNCRCMGRCHGAGVCSCEFGTEKVKRAEPKKVVDSTVGVGIVEPMMTPRQNADQLATRLHVAADKAGFGDALYAMRVGVIYSSGRYVVDYEPEVAEAGIEIDHNMLDRAQKWIDRVTGQV